MEDFVNEGTAAAPALRNWLRKNGTSNSAFVSLSAFSQL